MAIQGAAGAPPEDLVVATPEQVAFRFETAGLGSRFVAQLIDLLVLWGVLLALSLVSYGIGVLFDQLAVAVLVFVVAGFLSFWAYWILPEALWSGQTVGKYVLHLRVIDARGGPVAVGQVVVRNLLRIVDFLPASYALGTIVMFSSARNQRLGDLAAGTVVIRERMAVRLSDLDGAPAGARPDPTARRLGRRLDPMLQRFVRAYAQRRPTLAPERRAQLAAEAEPALRAALPDVVATSGALAALDQLADHELG
ncbi:MAG TPA: RDD family protein [Candidatus Dormibacteraeota bacterium]|nr:RDD family protein [Candidatus Dormibacteraeota bacterium]